MPRLKRAAGSTVRQATLERRLDGHVNDLGQRMSGWAVAFYRDVVLPLEQRVAWLELPWYMRLWYWVRAKWQVHVVGRWRAAAPDDGGTGDDS